MKHFMKHKKCLQDLRLSLKLLIVVNLELKIRNNYDLSR
jgi:hypothetical protein